MPELSVNEQSCTRCDQCVLTCPWGVIALPDGSRPQYTAEGAERCILCGHCEAVCPTGSITVDAPFLAAQPSPAQDWSMEPERLGAYLRSRRSIRSFREEPVDLGELEQVMDVVRYAPSGRNRQDVHWLIVHDTRETRRLTSLAIEWMRETATSDNPLAVRYNLAGMVKAWEEGIDHICNNAPHLVIAHVNEENPVARTNAVIALAHLDIVAPSFGLGACWGGIFMQAVNNWEPLRTALNFPAGHSAAHCLMLGYPASHYQRPPKRNLAAIVWR